MTWREHPLVDRVHYQVERVRAWARRATAAALAVRVAVWLAGTGALVLAAPPGLRLAGVAVLAAAVAGVAAGWPGSGWVGAVEIAAVLLFAVTVAIGPAVSLPRVMSLAALLYLHHTAAALAACLRTDAVVPAAVLRRWAGRAGLVLAVSAPLALGVATPPARYPAWPASVSVVLAVTSAVGVVAGLAYLWHRRADS
jgi:hypothetical protein